MLVNSRVSANELCNLLLKHPQLSHLKRCRKTDEKGTFVFCPFMLGWGVGLQGRALNNCIVEVSEHERETGGERERGGSVVAKCQHDKSNLYKQSLH